MGKADFPWPCFLFLRLTKGFRRCTLSKGTLILASACVVYLFFVASHVGYSHHHRDHRINHDNYRHTRGLYHLDTSDALSELVDLSTGANSVVPTRSNVVYITLKSKRLKPANIRGTVRPKLRRKIRRNKATNAAFTQEKLETLEKDARHSMRNAAMSTSWGNTSDVDVKSVEISHISDPNAKTHSSSIRIYSQRAPPWFSAQDMSVMRFLADAKILRVKKVSRGDSSSFLMFEGEASFSSTQKNYAQQNSMCVGQCGVIRSPVDTTEVFAFHLDRVLGLNRTIPAVSRKFHFLHDGQPCPVVSWDASLHTEALAASKSAVSLTWGAYQSSLKHRCWHRNIVPKSDSGCSTIHHYEWSKLALFDFLLQIHSRLDQSCCGFRPRVGDVCVEQDHHAECRDPDHIHLANIVHRGNDPRHLVFTDNKGFFDRNEDNLDFRLLEGIKELPEQAVSVMRSRRLREKLLQSLFLDQTYWESQGGRQGIDKLIEVIERRAKVLLTYINAHGILVTAMNV